MKKYLLAFLAVGLAFAFTTNKGQKANDDFYFSDDGMIWLPASSIQNAKDQTGCREATATFCANVYARHKLVIVNGEVQGIAQDPNNPGQQYQPDRILYYP